MKPWEQNFKSAFEQCLQDGVHPGPAEINQRLGRGRRNQLNTRQSELRVKLMGLHRVPYTKGRQKGKIPGEDEMRVKL